MRHSALYRGRVRHRRSGPAPHAFEYRIFLLYADLAEVPSLFDGRWLWSAERPNVASFRRRDYLGDPSRPLDDCVRELVQVRTGTRPAGPVRILTMPRFWGYVMNPVSFYYCFDAADRRVETIVAEITNTPWNERHAYVLGPAGDEGAASLHRWRFRKDFHVSPFFPMDLDYDWRFTDPGASLAVQMDLFREGAHVFDVTMTLERRELTGREMASALAAHPFMTGKAVAAIYWNAARLWMKRTPFFAHPAKAAAASGGAR